MAQIQIDGSAFSVNPLLGEASFLLQPLIVPAVPDFLALYASLTEGYLAIAGDDGDGDGKVDLDRELSAQEVLKHARPLLETATPVIERLCSKLPPDRLKYIIRTLLAGATMDGKPLYVGESGNPIDILLQGKTLTFWRLVLFAMRTSYPDFFSVADAFLAPAKAPEDSET